MKMIRMAPTKGVRATRKKAREAMPKSLRNPISKKLVLCISKFLNPSRPCPVAVRFSSRYRRLFKGMKMLGKT
jgi:hypothetical protein